MKAKLFTLFLCVLFFESGGALGQSAIKTHSSDCVLECVGITDKGDYIIVGTGFAKNVSSATQLIEYNAIFSLLFYGIKGSKNHRIKDIPPMISNRDFFYKRQDATIDSIYSQFIKPINGRVPKIIKTKGGYKVTNMFVVDKNALRKELESKNIINSF